ncbi:hypothetical protein F7725_015798 [Dissostichus mawsoni]|uniref:Ubiquitin carboxyl-terminal hydrolase 20 n=1 Tax=Dissostichus mawsoni TaxID=36200 RepID=A0A7J5YK18_DISMA|nr:hypothetical protein F7725_015798 [Dissostichus mawsoni]
MAEPEMCPHLDSIGEVTKEDLLEKSKSDCQYVGCGESFSDHSTLHAQAEKHNLTVNLTTFRIWCYVCEREVFLEHRPALLPVHAAPHTCKASEQEAPPQPFSHPLKGVPIAVAEDEGSESEEDEFFLDCSGLVRTDKKPALCKSYQKLISELWHKKRPSYVVPTSLSHGIKLVNPMFRGYAQQVGASTQQDTQEFLRCLMDQLHEELKEPLTECSMSGEGSDGEEIRDGERSPSEDEFLSCDSGSSSDRGEGGGGVGDGELLLQDECDGVRAPTGGGVVGVSTGGVISEKERLKERRVSGSPLRGGSQEMDEDADVDTAAEEEGPPEREDEEDPVRTLQELHPKLSSSPPRSSPLRSAGPAYAFKKAQLLLSARKKKQSHFRSVISDIFDGSILSLVQCLTCDRILCIHLKRFRHEVMYSFKISSHVSFPLEGLDMRPFLAKESPSQVTTYDLLSVICHHGTAGSGHYIAYCQNVINGQWYEFDDQYVTEVHETVVQNAEAYVLFYRKSSEESVRERQKVVALASMKEPSLLQFYISREWLNKEKVVEFVYEEKRIPPNKYNYVDDLVVIVPQNVWEYLYNSFGGGPAVNHLYMCAICQVEIEALAKRRKTEIDTFIKLNKEFQAEEAPTVILCISMQWFREWEGFVKGKDNGADYGQISEETWQYLLGIYGGGPEIAVRQTVAPADPDSLHGERKIEAETRAL